MYVCMYVFRWFWRVFCSSIASNSTSGIAQDNEESARNIRQATRTYLLKHSIHILAWKTCAASTMQKFHAIQQVTGITIKYDNNNVQISQTQQLTR